VESWEVLFEIVVLLAGCLAAGAVFARLKQSPLVGYLVAGMLLGGPGSLGVVRQASHIDAIAELGVALLLFSLGLEFSWRRLRALGTVTLLSGVFQVGATLVAVAAVAFLFGLGITAALAIGAMLALSSTAAVLRMLMDTGETDGVHGRVTIAILLVQDMAVVPLTILVTLLSTGGTTAEVALEVGRVIGLAVAFVLGLWLLLNQVAVRVLRSLSLARNREFAVLLAVVVGLGATWAAHAIGLSPALGSFLAGLFLGGSPFAAQIRADVASLRVVLLTLFFGAVGMVADPLWIASHAGLVVALAALIVVGKTAVVWLILRLAGRSDGVAAAAGLCLAQVGEFAFVLGAVARGGGLVDDATYVLVVSTAIVTLFTTPYLVVLAPRALSLVNRLRGHDPEPRDDGDTMPRPDVVIVGFGPAGQAVGRALRTHPRPVTVIDLNHAAQRPARALGFAAEVGDATQADVLEHAHVESARVVVITLPARSAALGVLDAVRALAPTAHVIVRSRHEIDTGELHQAGAHVVVGDEEEVGARLRERTVGYLDTTRPPAEPDEPV
jgi:CPA2 family monovalent cation:H+ antiporter-2